MDGRLLTGAFTATEQRGERLFVPVVTLARALGDSVRVRASDRVVEVRRVSGVVADFDAALGQVRENGVPTLLAGGAGEVVFPPNPDALMLPVEVASALLDASIVVDPAVGTVRVTRDLPQVMVARGDGRSLTDLYSLEYGYNLSASENSYSQNLQATAAGRVHDGRFGLNGAFTGGGVGSFLDFRYGLATYERPGGQRLMFGDLGTGSDLTFLSTAMRGGWWRQPVAGLDITTFAGRTRSEAAPTSPADAAVPLLQRYDTSIVGSYFTLGRGTAPSEGGPAQLLSSTGGMYFRGPEREGGLLTSSLQYTTEHHQFRTDLGLGSFDGLALGGQRVRGTGVMLDSSESLTPTESLTLSAGFTHVGENYLSAQPSGAMRAMNLYSGGMSWRPLRAFTLNSTARFLERLDLEARPTDRDLTSALALNPGGAWPSLLLTHSEGLQAEVGRRSYTLLNLTRTWGRYDFFSNLTRTRTGVAPVSLNLTVGAGRRFKTAELRGYQSVGSGRALSGGVDFLTPAFLSHRVSVGTGVGYSRQGEQWTSTARVALAVQMPAQQRLRLTYTQSNVGGQVYLELAGPLWSSPGAERASERALASLQTLGAFSGRVYQDLDLDGRYDAQHDKPLANVQVQLDGNNTVITDAEGRYRVANLPAGQHTVYLNLNSVRADLSLLSGAEQQVMLLPDHDAVVDFRLIRTGRASGLVWLDANENGVFDEGEDPLPDVRVVAGNRDTLTNGQGEFVLGDLPQGGHTVLVDEKTLPEGVEAATRAVSITITPPRETGNVMLPARGKPVEVDVKEF